MPLITRRDEPIHLFLQLAEPQVAAIFNDDLEAATRAEAGHRRRREQADIGLRYLLSEVFAHTVGYGEAVHPRIAALVELIERDEELAKVGAVGVQRERLPGDAGRMHNAVLGAAALRIENLGDAIDDFLRALQRSAVRQLHRDIEPPLILVGNVSAGQSGGRPPRQHQEAAIDDEHNRAGTQGPAHDARVPIRSSMKCPIKGAKKPAQPPIEHSAKQVFFRAARGSKMAASAGLKSAN